MKVATYGERRVVKYDSERWKLLKEKRKVAKEIMETLEDFGIPSILYGSVARGDVKESSDVDIFVPLQIPSFKIELALSDFEILEKRIIQATPNHVVKGEFVLANANVSFPLAKMKDRELDFYKFGGAITLAELKKDKRVCGVDKRLVLIIPESFGHVEIPINELDKSEVAKILGVGVDIVEERIRVLERRREIGRTGVFLKEKVAEFDSFEKFLEKISERNQLVRRRVKL